MYSLIILPSRPYVHLSIYPSTNPYIYQSVYPLTHISILPSTGHKSIFQSTHPFLAIFLSILLSSIYPTTTHPSFLFISIHSVFIWIHPPIHSHSLSYLLTCYFSNLNICPFVHLHAYSCIHLSNLLYSLTNPTTYLVYSSIYLPSHYSLTFTASFLLTLLLFPIHSFTHPLLEVSLLSTF